MLPEAASRDNAPAQAKASVLAALGELPELTPQALVDEALDVVAALGAAVPSLDPPAELKGRVLTAARAEPGTPVRPVRRPAPAPSASEASAS